MLERITHWISGQREQKRCCCFHFGRCGSTVLGNLLNAHPAIDWQSELFHPLHEKTSKLESYQDPLELLTRPLQESKASTFGFETKFQHLDESGLNLSIEGYLQTLKNLNFEYVILLSRRNYLKQAISVARGQLMHAWHFKSNETRPEIPAFLLDIDQVGLGGRDRKILECFEFLDQTYRMARMILPEFSDRFIEIEYEEHIESDPHIGFEKAIEFMGLPRRNPEISLRKIDERPVRSMIENFEQVKSCLAGTSYEWMVEE